MRSPARQVFCLGTEVPMKNIESVTYVSELRNFESLFYTRLANPARNYYNIIKRLPNAAYSKNS